MLQIICTVSFRIVQSANAAAGCVRCAVHTPCFVQPNAQHHNNTHHGCWCISTRYCQLQLAALMSEDLLAGILLRRLYISVTTIFDDIAVIERNTLICSANDLRKGKVVCVAIKWQCLLWVSPISVHKIWLLLCDIIRTDMASICYVLLGQNGFCQVCTGLHSDVGCWKDNGQLYDRIHAKMFCMRPRPLSSAHQTHRSTAVYGLWLCNGTYIINVVDAADRCPSLLLSGCMCLSNKYRNSLRHGHPLGVIQRLIMGFD